MSKSLVRMICCAALTAFQNAHATGGFTPQRWLDNGGIASDMSPEFYWDQEVRRMAEDYHPPEKHWAPFAEAPVAAPDKKPAETTQGARQALYYDKADFDDAIKSGRIKPGDPEKAKAAHEAARRSMSVTSDEAANALPDEFASEFADYHRGAFAFRKGAAHFAEARKEWEALLARPKGERHYRSVWAAFMLGKLALAEKNPDAVKWFRTTRELAKEGFEDSVALAADSYGWEARSELRQGHDEVAAQLYLTQLATGDDGAIVSLKAVIADRPRIDGVKNYDEPPPDNATPEQLQKWTDERETKIQARLDAAARSPLLRRLETAHVLATETQAQIWSYGGDYNLGDTKPGERCRRWLDCLRKADCKDVADADHLGWVAYTAGRYAEAASWLAIAKQDSSTALWLKAKLQRREGNLAEATKTMSVVFKQISAERARSKDEEYSVFTYGDPGYSPRQSAAGDLAGLHLARGEFVDAMDAFLAGELWEDAAFIGDRVLTADELKRYVDAHFPNAVQKPTADGRGGRDYPKSVRWMLARRLVREDRYDDARGYFPLEQQGALDKYVAALKKANNTTLPKTERAHALFDAAYTARYDGMELMGTEVEPDGFESGGAFPPGNLDTERTEGATIVQQYDEAKKRDVEIRKKVKIFITPTAEEKKRIAQNRPHPANRFHYRWIASALAWKAAGLMPDGTEELADVLNCGGSWIKDRDGEGADKFIQAIEHRCPRTKIGQAVMKKHWFVSSPGPWSAQPEKQPESDNR